MSVLDRPLAGTPLAVIDFETTGLSPDVGSKVVEVAVVRIEPGAVPVLTVDTLVDPQGPVHCTRIHGITDEDVEGAPLFGEVAGPIVEALSGAVVAAFNASFDMRFLQAELHGYRRGREVPAPPPHVCLMYFRPLVGLGKRCRLEVACEAHGLQPPTHRAASDALAAGQLWQHYLEAAQRAGHRTYRDLVRTGTYKFLGSLDRPPYGPVDVERLGGPGYTVAPKPRDPTSPAPEADRPLPVESRRRIYWRALLEAAGDGVLTIGEASDLRGLQTELRLPPEELMAMHARYFGECLQVLAEDNWLSGTEAGLAEQLRTVLQALGWAPGEPRVGWEAFGMRAPGG